VFTLSVPPLRDAGEDRLLLFEHYRKLFAAQAGLQPVALDEEARRRWLDYAFPGNVRELRNIVIRLATKYGGQRISRAELDPELDLEAPAPGAPTLAADGPDLVEQALRHLEHARGFNLDDALKALERGYIEAALKLTRGNVSQAAKLLGVNRTTLYSRMGAPEADK
jgi:DNA-binding NtrC family response regulator